jgi:Fic/DOC family N-terminal
LGRLDFAVRRLPQPRLLVPSVLRREAQSTSELEGTYAPLDEVLAADFIEEAHRSAELREVMNYVVAAERAFTLIQTRAICLNDCLKTSARGGCLAVRRFQALFRSASLRSGNGQNATCR